MDNNMQNEINRLKADYAELEHEYESLGESFVKNVEMVRHKREEIDRLKTELKSLKSENAKFAGDISDLKGRNRFLVERLDNEKWEREKKKNMEQEIKNMVQELETSKKYISSLKGSLENSEKFVESLRDENLKRAYEIAALKKETQVRVTPVEACESIAEEKAYKCGGSCNCAEKDTEINKLKCDLKKIERIKDNFKLMHDCTCRENDLLERMNKMLETSIVELKTENIELKKKNNSKYGSGGDSGSASGNWIYKPYCVNPGSIVYCGGGGGGGVQNEGTILIT